MRHDGSYVGRAAPEIDVFEATIENGEGWVRRVSSLPLHPVAQGIPTSTFIRSRCPPNGPRIMQGTIGRTPLRISSSTNLSRI